jgi:hypothetical protein
VARIHWARYSLGKFLLQGIAKFRRIFNGGIAMARLIAKSVALALLVGAVGSASPVSAEPPGPCAPEGGFFWEQVDPSNPNIVNAYQCRAGVWRFLAQCHVSSCPSPDPGGPIVEA